MSINYKSLLQQPTVSPFVSVVVSVFKSFRTVGVANPLFSREISLKMERARSPLLRLSANLRDAMKIEDCVRKNEGKGVGTNSCKGKS